MKSEAIYNEVVRHPATFLVKRVEDLPRALAGPIRKVVLENDELNQRFAQLHYWQRAPWWVVSTFVFYRLNMALVRDYKIDPYWHLSWNLEQSLEGRMFLYPSAWDDSGSLTA